jgi:hypothetical protein
MRFQGIFCGTALAASLLMPGGLHAATLTTDFAAWSAAVGSYSNTSSTGLTLYDTVTTVPLSDGATLSLSGAADTLLQPLSGWGPWSGTYGGDIIDTTTNSETISFSGRNALGLDLSPDVPFFGSGAETFTVTLSDGTTTTISGTYPAGVTQFVGFYGGGVDSMTISTTNAADFAFGNIVDAPEPLSLSLLVAGLAGLGVARRRG